MGMFCSGPALAIEMKPARATLHAHHFAMNAMHVFSPVQKRIPQRNELTKILISFFPKCGVIVPVIVVAFQRHRPWFVTHWLQLQKGADFSRSLPNSFSQLRQSRENAMGDCRQEVLP
jgi:hypothetical protein